MSQLISMGELTGLQTKDSKFEPRSHNLVPQPNRTNKPTFARLSVNARVLVGKSSTCRANLDTMCIVIAVIGYVARCGDIGLLDVITMGWRRGGVIYFANFANSRKFRYAEIIQFTVSYYVNPLTTRYFFHIFIYFEL